MNPVLRTLLLVSLLCLAACSSAPKRNVDTANAVLFRAIDLVGTPYRYGGNTPQGGFDCSGLVGYVYRDAAQLQLPRTSAQIAQVKGSKLKRSQLQPGDLVFFRSKRKISHVGIYAGEGRFVHAPNRGGTVRLDRLDGHWWNENFAWGKRVIR